METIKLYCESAEIEVLELKNDTLVLVDKMNNTILTRGTEMEIAKYIIEVILDFEEKTKQDKEIFKRLAIEYFES